jgi:hypothetical protein
MTISHGQLVAGPTTIGKSTPNEDFIAPAQRIVAEYSKDAGECRELLAMLGLLPGQEQVDMSEEIDLGAAGPFAGGKGVSQ